METKITLAPGESKELAFVLGMKNDAETEAVMNSYADVHAQSEAELAELKEYWHGKLNHFQVKTPSESFNAMINTWNAYQCFMTFI